MARDSEGSVRSGGRRRWRGRVFAVVAIAGPMVAVKVETCARFEVTVAVTCPAALVVPLDGVKVVALPLVVNVTS